MHKSVLGQKQGSNVFKECNFPWSFRPRTPSIEGDFGPNSFKGSDFGHGEKIWGSRLNKSQQNTFWSKVATPKWGFRLETPPNGVFGHGWPQSNMISV